MPDRVFTPEEMVRLENAFIGRTVTLEAFLDVLDQSPREVAVETLLERARQERPVLRLR